MNGDARILSSYSKLQRNLILLVHNDTAEDNENKRRLNIQNILYRGGQGQKSGQVTKTLQCVTI